MATLLTTGFGDIFTRGSTFVETVKAFIDLQLNPDATALDKQAAYASLAGTATAVLEVATNNPVFKGVAQVAGGTAAVAGLGTNIVQLNESIAKLAKASAGCDAEAIFEAQRDVVDKAAGTTSSVGGVIMAVPGGQVLGGAIWLGASGLQQIAKNDTVAESTKEVAVWLGEYIDSPPRAMEHITIIDPQRAIDAGLIDRNTLLPKPELLAQANDIGAYKDITNSSTTVTDLGTILITAPICRPDGAFNTLDNYLSADGNKLSSAQVKTLTHQIDKLGLGGEDNLSFYTLPNGSALIANADGDIVGEINRSNSGSLQLKATAIDADGHTVEVNNHIAQTGGVQTQAEFNAQAQAEYNAATQQQASAMFNSLMALNSWEHLSDVGKLSVLMNLYNATDKLGEAFGATGDNLPGDLGLAAGYLQLAQGLESGDSLIIANGLNTVSGGAVDQAIGSLVGEQLPYVSTLLELRNFAENPEVALGTLAGTYVGSVVGAAFGPIGVAIGGALGGMVGGMLGGGGSPPPPEGAVHFSWDESGHIQHTVDVNQSGGGVAANSIAASVQTMLQNLVEAHKAQNTSTADDIAINPYLLPRMGFSGGGAWMEVVLPDGSTLREGIKQESFAQRLLDVLQDNGGIAPAWQVQTQQQHDQQAPLHLKGATTRRPKHPRHRQFFRHCPKRYCAPGAPHAQ